MVDNKVPTKEQRKKAEEAMAYLSDYIQEYVYHLAPGTIDKWQKVRFSLNDYHEALSCDGVKKIYLGPGRYQYCSE